MKKSLVLALALLSLGAPVAEARVRALDPSFGRGGKAAWPINLGRTWEEAASATSRLPDGGAVALVGNSLLALRPNGTPMWRFARGPTRISLPLLASETITDLVTDRQGRVVVVGTVTSPTDPSRQWLKRDESVVVARYTPRGYPDRTFGERGLLVTDLGFGPPPIEPPPTQPMDPPAVTRGAGVAIDARGRIVLSGIHLSRIATCQYRDFSSDYFVHKDGFVARLQENGDLDPSFGQGGLAVIPETRQLQAPLLTRSGGTLLLREPTTDCYGSIQQMSRVTPQGVLDTRFGPSWLMPKWDQGSLALDRRGGVIVLQAGDESVTRENSEGRPESDSFNAAILQRLLPSGKRDTSFGHKGEAVVMRGRPGFVPSEVLVDGKNRILVAGAPTPNDDVEGAGSFLLARLSAEGKIDKRFGRRGWMQARWGEEAIVGGLSAAFVGGGRVLVSGILSDPQLKYDVGVGVARFRTR